MMFEPLRKSQGTQHVLGLVFGFLFGFLLQKGGVCYYEVIVKQLLLEDFTVIKVMATACVTGMLGVYAMKSAGWIQLHKKPGSLGTNIPGPLIFGVGFGLLGYCPGTAVGAVGHGALDALVGGIIGITIGAGIYAAVYPKVKDGILKAGSFGDITLVDVVNAKNPWTVVLPVATGILLLLFILEYAGF